MTGAEAGRRSRQAALRSVVPKNHSPRGRAVNDCERPAYLALEAALA
ncbi:hypothetical protein RHECNPAF_4310036 [Rhizobium etli CNPAF512]|nr:hypothetical protein RHECNPAF_4310036 [Rhizobium etli CNPAF512]